MSFLKRLLIEQEEDDFNVQEEYYDEPDVDMYVDAELETVNRDTLIDDIYNENNIADKSQSIFKVEEIMNSLPKEMPTATKQATVKSIMSSFGLTETMVISDAERRNAILSSIACQVKEIREDEIKETKEKIELCKQEIERLEKVISEAEIDMKVTKEKIDAETERINSLMNFIYGGE